MPPQPPQPQPPTPRSILDWARAGVGAALVAYLVMHLAQCWPLLSDPALYAAAVAERHESGSARHAAIWVLGLVALNAVLAALGARRRAAQQVVPGARGLDLVQHAAGLLASAFVVYHVAEVRVLEQGPELGAWDGYGALLVAMEQTPHFVAYVVGVTALCFHLAFGAARFTSGSAHGSRRLRIVFGTLGLLLWALWLQPLARLATGAAMF